MIYDISCKKRLAGYRFNKNECIRPLFMEAWLQNPAHLC